MSLEVAIYTLLTTNTDILAAGCSTRVYPAGEVPDRPTLPFMVYTRVSTAHLSRTHSGKVFQTPRFQIDIYAESSKKGTDIGEVLDSVLDSYVGTIGSYRIQPIEVVDRRGTYEDESGNYLTSVDIIVWGKPVS